MLLIEIARIPPEGIDIDEALTPESLHMQSETEFRLPSGGRLKGHVELIDGSTAHVRGRLDAVVEPECGRCLEPYSMTIGQELDLFFLPQAAEQPEAQEEEVELSDRDVVVGYYEHGRLDLGDVMREQIFLAVPLKRLCREECRGLCPVCGKNLNAADCGCPPPQEPEDPRLAPLRRLIDDQKN